MDAAVFVRGKLRGGRGLAKPQGSGKKAASADEKTQGYLYRRSGFCKDRRTWDQCGSPAGSVFRVRRQETLFRLHRICRSGDGLCGKVWVKGADRSAYGSGRTEQLRQRRHHRRLQVAPESEGGRLCAECVRTAGKALRASERVARHRSA